MTSLQEGAVGTVASCDTINNGIGVTGETSEDFSAA